MNIRYQQELLQQIAAGVNKHHERRIYNLKVTLKTDADAYEFTLAQALDALANDLYWDERGNWAEARIAEVDVY